MKEVDIGGIKVTTIPQSRGQPNCKGRRRVEIVGSLALVDGIRCEDGAPREYTIVIAFEEARIDWKERKSPGSGIADVRIIFRLGESALIVEDAEVVRIG